MATAAVPEIGPLVRVDVVDQLIQREVWQCAPS